jgi:hypothetical protein
MTMNGPAASTRKNSLARALHECVRPTVRGAEGRIVMTRTSRLLSSCVVVCLLTPLTGAAQAAPQAPSSCPRCIACADDAAGLRTVRVKVYNRSPVDQAGLAALLDVTNRIWLPYGVRIEPVTGLDAIAVVVSEGQRASASADVRAVLGETLFTRHHATPYIRLWLGAAEAAADATPTDGVSFRARRREEREAILRRMMGVALAHELAHYLLDTAEHSPRGLLRQVLTVRDLQQPDLTRLELSWPQQGLPCNAAGR